MAETIYSLINAFYLEIGGQDYRIREPILWSKVESSIIRDLETHGVDINFPSNDSRLEFANTPEKTTGNKSKALIDAEYNLNGQDSEVILKFGTLDQNLVFTEISRGRIDFSKGYTNELHTSKASITFVSEKQRILDYYDAPIKMKQITDVTGDTLLNFGTPAINEVINLHSQELIKKTHKELQETIYLEDLIDYDLTDPEWSNTLDRYYFQYGFPNTILEDGVEDLGLETFITPIDPTSVFKANFKTLDASSKLTLKRFLCQVSIETVSFAPNDWTADTYLAIGTLSPDNETITYTKILLYADSGTVGVGSPVYAAFQAIIITDEIVEYIQKGQYILIYTEFNAQGPLSPKKVRFDDIDIIIPEIDPGVRPYNQQVVFELNTISKPTRNRAYSLFTAVEFCVRCILNEADRFKSDLFMGNGGNGENMYIVGGYDLRNIPDIDKPGTTSDAIIKSPTMSLKDAFESCNTMFLLGQNIETDQSGNQIVVWEEVEYFYQDHEIINLTGKTSNFIIKPNDQLSINLINISYPNISVRETSGGGSIEAVNTNIEVSLPLLTATKKYNKKSKWRTEGYDIETARRTSKLNKESVRTDEDVFLINTVDAEPFVTEVLFISDDNTIQFLATTYETLKKYNRLEITGTASNNKTINYDATKIEKAGFLIAIFTEEALVDEGGVFATFTPSGVNSRQNEGFDITEFVENDIDFLEATIEKKDLYNMLLQPIRVLMHHTKWLNAVAWFKDKLATINIGGKSILINRYFTLEHSNASNFRTKLNINETVIFGDTQRLELLPIKNFTNDATTYPEENGFAISDGYDGKSILGPNIYMFKAEISLDDYNTIKEAMNGQGATPYGYISTIDNDGNPVSGYILRLEGDPNTNIYDVELLQRGNFYE